MMESVRHRSAALPTGMVASTLLHIVTAAYLVFWISRPAPVEDRPVDLSKAIPIMMQQLRPEPPKPEPPKPRPKEPPKPIPTPETIETTAAQQAIETPAEKVEPPKEPVKYEEPPPPAGAPYASFVRGVIEKEKRYPREALMSGDQGTAMVYFVINRFGTVLMFRVEKRTGSSSLDAEVKRLMRRIQQFPAVPAHEYVGKERIEFTVAVDFKLQD